MAKVLVIDDDAVQRALLLAVFRKQGLEVLQAANGQEGIRLARDGRPDLIVSDVNLPEMDGFAVLENLRKEPITAAIPFIIITANPDAADQRRATESGASGYLPKPISISNLQALVNAEIGKKKRTVLRTAKVLVIDDDDGFRAALIVMLEKHGIEVFQASGGAEGVQIARDHQPDLILCDVNMEGADGRLTLYALRRDPTIASIPFFLMSGNTLSGEALPGSGRGADGFLLKPFTQQKLLTTIGSCLDKVQPHSEGVQPDAAINNETSGTSLQEALLGPLEQVIEATRRISTTNPQDAHAEVKRLAEQAHQSALRLKRLIEEQIR